MFSTKEPRKRTPRLIASLLLGATVVLFAATVCADPLLTVTGPGDLGFIINSDQAAAVSFTLTQPFKTVSITADLTGISAAGGVFLMSDLGPTATAGDIVASVDFTSVVFAGSATVLFSDLRLEAGDYAVVVASDQNAPTSTVIWNGSTTPDITVASDVVDGIDFFSADSAAFPPASDFNVVFDRSAHFSVTGSPATVPTETETWGSAKVLFRQ